MNHGNICFSYNIEIDKLNNTNNNTWSIELQMLLMKNEIWGVVDLN